MQRFSKRGLSPVIATLLLIGLALTLAVIIFLWARLFVGEQLTKGNSVIDNSCDAVHFDASASGNSLTLTNTGDIALYGVELREVSTGTIRAVQSLEGSVLLKGETQQLDISGALQNVQTPTTLRVVPILLGETSAGQKKSHVCNPNTGVDVSVS